MIRKYIVEIAALLPMNRYYRQILLFFLVKSRDSSAKVQQFREFGALLSAISTYQIRSVDQINKRIFEIQSLT